MAGKVEIWETQFLSLILNNTAPSSILIGTGGLRSSSTAGSLYIALFTGDPGETGSIANEATYTSYARKSVARSGALWTVSAGEATNASAITFVTCTGGSNLISHWGICKGSVAGVADLLFYGSFSAGLTVNNTVTPQIPAGNITLTED